MGMGNGEQGIFKMGNLYWGGNLKNEESLKRVIFKVRNL